MSNLGSDAGVGADTLRSARASVTRPSACRRRDPRVPASTPGCRSRQRPCSRAGRPSARGLDELAALILEAGAAFYRDKLGLELVEERTGGLRHVCGPAEFHLFSSAGTPSGESTQMAFEVKNLEATLADLRDRGVTFERFEMSGFDVSGDTIAAPDNYSSKGTGRARHVLLRQRKQPHRDRPAGPRGRNTRVAWPGSERRLASTPGRARCRQSDHAI